MNIRIAFRLDCGAAIGSGHLIRCGALAEEFAARGCEVLLICRNRVTVPAAFPIWYLKHPYTDDSTEKYIFPSIEDEVGELVEVLNENRISCLIVDHYGAAPTYFEKLRPHVDYLAAIDDMAKYPLPVDVVINGNVYANERDYKDVPLRLCGPTYTLLRRCFRDVGQKKIRDRLREVYITSGGADPMSLCERVLSVCLAWNMEDVVFHVIIGPSFQPRYVRELTALAAKNHNVKLLHGADMADCMRKADLFVTASGSTLYELAVCGVPNISIVLAEDQQRTADEMHRRGVTFNIGAVEQMEKVLPNALNRLSDAVVRWQMSAFGQNLIDGYGVQRTADQMMRRIGKRSDV